MTRRTAFSTTQFVETLTPLHRAWAKALVGRDPAQVTAALDGKGARLADMLNTDLNLLSVPTAEQMLPSDGDWSFESWLPFYGKHFSDQLNTIGGEDAINTSLFSPNNKAGFNWSIMVLEGLTPNAAYSACERNFKCWRYSDDLDKNIVLNGREPATTYGVWVRNRLEADEEYQNLSGNDVAVRGIAGMTVLERELLELKYWSDTGKHLDLENVTLCTGSRNADGFVPDANWCDGKFSVGWSDPADRDPGLRVREVSV
jgi:hypothetical protein